MLRITCVGRVVRDPHTNDPAEGKKKFTAITLVSNRYAGTNQDGTPKYESEFLNCVAFDRTAEALTKVVKGQTLWVYGEASVNTYEKDGKASATLQCVVREWERVASAPSAAEEGAPAKPAKATTADDDADGGSSEEEDPFAS